MGGDDYVVDENGAWGTKSDALIWYRQELDRLKAAFKAEQDPVEAASTAMRQLTDEQRLEVMEPFCTSCGCVQNPNDRCQCFYRE